MSQNAGAATNSWSKGEGARCKSAEGCVVNMAGSRAVCMSLMHLLHRVWQMQLLLCSKVVCRRGEDTFTMYKPISNAFLQGRTPLHGAIYNGHYDTTKQLLKYPAAIEALSDQVSRVPNTAHRAMR